MRLTSLQVRSWLLLAVAPAAAGGAQERLIGRRSLGGGASFEAVSFGSDGLRQMAFAGLDSVYVMRVRQSTMPVAAATPLGLGWRLDVTVLYASGRVSYRDAGASGPDRVATLSGVSDVRLRATGRFLSDAVTLTFGANAPSGRTVLTGTEFSALRVLAAAALGLGSAPVGTGPSGTLGVVVAQQAGPWALAFGASYEHRGRYQPIAALTAGAPSADFRPGGVVRASVGAERIIGPHRLSLAVASDMFASDRLRGAVEGAAPGAPEATLATVRLGPVFSGDVQMQLAASRLRDVVVYTSYLWRAAYARDGITADGSSGHYAEGGMRAALPVFTRAELVFATGARWHSGLGVDEGLATSGVRSADLTVGVRARRGMLSIQPYVRGQGGTLRARTVTASRTSQSFAGFAGGLVIQTRF